LTSWFQNNFYTQLFRLATCFSWCSW